MARKKKFAEYKTTWEIAEALLKMPNVPVIIHTNNHEYRSDLDRISHGAVRIEKADNGKRVRIGNFDPNDDLEELSDEG